MNSNKNIVLIKKYLNKLYTFHKERKYSINTLKTVLNNIEYYFLNNNIQVQKGGVKYDRIIEEINKLGKNISVLNTKDFKNLIDNIEEFIDVFETNPSPSTGPNPNPISSTP